MFVLAAHLILWCKFLIKIAISRFWKLNSANFCYVFFPSFHVRSWISDVIYALSTRPCNFESYWISILSHKSVTGKVNPKVINGLQEEIILLWRGHNLRWNSKNPRGDCLESDPSWKSWQVNSCLRRLDGLCLILLAALQATWWLSRVHYTFR